MLHHKLSRQELWGSAHKYEFVEDQKYPPQTTDPPPPSKQAVGHTISTGIKLTWLCYASHPVRALLTLLMVFCLQSHSVALQVLKLSQTAISIGRCMSQRWQSSGIGVTVLSHLARTLLYNSDWYFAYKVRSWLHSRTFKFPKQGPLQAHRKTRRLNHLSLAFL